MHSLRLLPRLSAAGVARQSAAVARSSSLPLSWRTPTAASVSAAGRLAPAVARFHTQPRALAEEKHASTPSSTPSSTAASSATPSPSSSSSLPPPTNADEQTDAEAGLDRPVQPQPQPQQSQQQGEKESEPKPAAADASTKETSSSGGNGGVKSGASKADAEAGQEKQGPVSWRSLGLLLLVGGGAVIYFRYEQEKQQNTVRVETIGTPLLGGPFNLVDHTGRRVSSEDLKGKYILLYFGFTFCPDICPTELKKMEEALALYAKVQPSHPILPVFISIDPRRDTPSRLASYRKEFMPQMLWLTGSDEEIRAVAKAYRVYYSAPDVAEGADEHYLVDHSIFFYLLDREGQFMDFFGKSKSAEEVAARMDQLVAAENK